MQPHGGPCLPCKHSWCLGDWFESVLLQLAPADIAAARLVSKAWRAQVGAALYQLSPASAAAECEELAAAAAAAFPRLLSLHLTLRHSSLSAAQPQHSTGGLAAALSQYAGTLGLRRLSLAAPASSSGKGGPTRTLCHISMRHLGALCHLESLCLSGLQLHCSSGSNSDSGGSWCGGSDSWRQLSSLTSLELADCTLVVEVPAQLSSLGCIEGSCCHEDLTSSSSSGGSKGSTLMCVLRPLSRLRRLVLRGRVGVELEGPDGVFMPRRRRTSSSGGGSGSNGSGSSGVGSNGCEDSLLAGVSCLGGGPSRLEELVVDGEFDLPPGTWAEVAGLPCLLRLEYSRPPWVRRQLEELSLTNNSLALLAERAPQLQGLTLRGHALLTDAALGHIARLAHLKELCLRADLHEPWTAPGGDTGFTDQGLCQLASLGGLRSLQLAGYPLREGGCGALAALRELTHLELSGCEDLGDEAVHRLSCLSRLRELALVDCPRVGDIAICFLLKHTTRLTSLDLSGSYLNLSDVGLLGIGRARELRRLSLSHCHHISESGLAALLPRLPSLAHLSLRDCTQLGPKSCSLLAAAAPLLETLDLEYCRGVCIAPLAHMRRLHHARVHGVGASEAALLALVAGKAGRRLTLERGKPCWWILREA